MRRRAQPFEAIASSAMRASSKDTSGFSPRRASCIACFAVHKPFARRSASADSSAEARALLTLAQSSLRPARCIASIWALEAGAPLSFAGRGSSPSSNSKGSTSETS